MKILLAELEDKNNEIKILNIDLISQSEASDDTINIE